MPESGGQPTESSTDIDAYQAEVIVLLAYVKLFPCHVPSRSRLGRDPNALQAL
jgi:hypothetical protein